MAEQASVNRNVNIVGALTGMSRLFGLVREMLTSRLIGAGLEQSAFVFAFTIPNLFRKLFGEGALSAAFVPVYKEEVELGRRESAEQLACAVSSMLGAMLGGICLLGMLVISFALPAFEPGGKTAPVLQMTRIMLPYAVFICAAAFAMGVQNACGRFGRAAFAPAILNLVWIATLLGLFFFPELPVRRRVFIVAWAVLASGFLQMAFLIHAVWRNGVRLRPMATGWRTPLARTVWRNTFVGALGMGAVQINLVLDNALALWAAPWAPAAISYAERLVYLPLGVVATAFATVLLPSLAGHFARGDAEGAKRTLAESAEDVLLLTIPAATGLALLSLDVVTVLYQGGEFTAQDSIHVSRALMCYAPGLLVFSLNKVLLPWFYAQKDMKKLVAYSSVSHLGFCTLGIFALNQAGLNGSIIQQINHGISTGALFLIVGILYERRHTREIAEYGGISNVMPVYATITMIMFLSSMGLPLLNGFIGEFTILQGAFLENKMWAAWAVPGVVLAAAYLLWLYQRVFFGKVTNEKNEHLADLTPREVACFVPLLLLAFAIGLYPKPLFQILDKPVNNLVVTVRNGGPQAPVNALEKAAPAAPAAPAPAEQKKEAAPAVKAPAQAAAVASVAQGQ
jgi:murein biosynthesis integral membrane protein MurJ